MPSKIRGLVLFLFSAVLILAGCDRFLNSGSKSKSVIKVPSSEFACLKTWPGQLKSYFQDELDTNQTDQLATCIDSALTTFETFARGQTANQFTNDELLEFLNRYMFEHNQISPTFMAQMMKLKVVFLGGSETLMTSGELTKTHQLLTLLGQQAQSLRGQWKLFLFNADPKQITPENLKNSQQLLQASVNTLIDFSDIEHSNYNWNDFNTLLDEASGFMTAKDVMGNLKKWMPFTNTVRNLFIGNSTDFTTKDGWHSAGKWTNDVYAGIIRVYYRLKNVDMESASTWASMIDFADMAFGLLQNSPQFSANHILRVEDLDAVVDQASNLDILPDTVSSEVAKATYRHLLSILKQGESLTGAEAVDWKRVEGFDQDMMNTLSLEYRIWKLSESEIVQSFQDKESLPLAGLVSRFSSVNLSAANQASAMAGLSVSDQAHVTRAWSDWMGILRSPYPLTFINGSHLLIPALPQTTSVNAYSLTVLNAIRSLVRVVQMGYGIKPNSQSELWDGVMSQATVQAWESDFEDFGRGIHFLDPRQSDSATRFYSDSGFFAFSSQGSVTRSSQQMLELISMMISGGKVVANEMMTALAADHCLTSLKDASFQEPMAEQKCFEASFKKNFASLFVNLPNLVQEVNSKAMSLDDLVTQLEIISADATKTAGYVEYGEIRTMGGVLHYLEAIMAVYDTNHNQTLDVNELSAAYPRFQSVVSAVSPMKDWFTEDAYLYLLYKGQVPSTSGGWWSKLSAGADFAAFAMEDKSQLPEVHRMNLLKVLAVLKQSTSKSAASAAVASSPTDATVPVDSSPALAPAPVQVSSKPYYYRGTLIKPPNNGLDSSQTSQ